MGFPNEPEDIQYIFGNSKHFYCSKEFKDVSNFNMKNYGL
jgi:hypothetical protein